VRDQFYIICEGHDLPPPVTIFPDMKVRLADGTLAHAGLRVAVAGM
jgi:hypothetical protein